MAFVEESLGLALAQLCKAHHQYVDLALRELGLYAGQEMVLFSLFRQEGQTQIQLRTTWSVNHQRSIPCYSAWSVLAWSNVGVIQKMLASRVSISRSGAEH